MLREDGGLRLAEHVAKELRTLGMADEHVAAWIDESTCAHHRRPRRRD